MNKNRRPNGTWKKGVSGNDKGMGGIYPYIPVPRASKYNINPIKQQIKNKMESYTMEENEDKKQTMVDQVKAGMKHGQEKDPDRLTFWQRVFETAHKDEGVMKCVINTFPKELLREVCGYEGVEEDRITIIDYRKDKDG